MKSLNLSKEVLEQKYINEGKSWAEIAEELDCDQATVYKYKKLYQIKNRGRSKLRGINKIGLIGRKFGCAEVLEFSHNANDGARVWKCKCNCGRFREITTEHLKNEYENCKCELREDKTRGFENIPVWFIKKIKSSANRRGLEVDIDAEYLNSIFSGYCKYTGVKISIEKNYKDTTASLDRIDSSKGYLKDNIQFVHKDINIMKMDMSEEKFLDWCKMVTEHSKTLSDRER